MSAVFRGWFAPVVREKTCRGNPIGDEIAQSAPGLDVLDARLPA
jgi:hypothetical protein